MLGTVSLVVGLGTAAFSLGGGGEAAPGPRITPPVEVYSVEHAITTGEVPFTGPTEATGSVDEMDPLDPLNLSVIPAGSMLPTKPAADQPAKP